MYYGGRQQMQVGSPWYGSNVMMTIPDVSAFEVAFAIGEEYRGKVSPGAKAIITADAIPGLSIEGELKKIEGLARPRISYDPQSPKVFQATVSCVASDPRMSTGMSTRVEIVAEVVKDVISVPVEAVFNEDGTPTCYVRNGAGSERRAVKPGKSNDSMVEICEGLAEGEEVDLSPSRGAVAATERDAKGKPEPDAKNAAEAAKAKQAAPPQPPQRAQNAAPSQAAVAARPAN
jgi:hypothetical protein